MAQPNGMSARVEEESKYLHNIPPRLHIKHAQCCTLREYFVVCTQGQLVCQVTVRVSLGWFLMKRRLQELDFVVSPSQLETPRDGNCMFHSIYDQLQYNAALRTFCGSQQELRVEVVNRGFTSFLSTGRLTWPGDPQLGTPDTWRRRMLRDGEWGDEVFLHLASNVLEVNIVIITAYRESAVHQGPGLTVVRCLQETSHQPIFLFSFSESDFASPHYQSVRPCTAQHGLTPLPAPQPLNGSPI